MLFRSIVVTPDRTHVLLHRHKRLGIWVQPGGHIEPGETPWLAAARETTEETGLPVVLVAGSELAHIDVHPGPRGHTHLDLRYLMEAPHRSPSPPEGESPDVCWLTWDEAIERADAGLVGALRALDRKSTRLNSSH